MLPSITRIEQGRIWPIACSYYATRGCALLLVTVACYTQRSGSGSIPATAHGRLIATSELAPDPTRHQMPDHTHGWWRKVHKKHPWEGHRRFRFMVIVMVMATIDIKTSKLWFRFSIIPFLHLSRFCSRVILRLCFRITTSCCWAACARYNEVIA